MRKRTYHRRNDFKRKVKSAVAIVLTGILGCSSLVVAAELEHSISENSISEQGVSENLIPEEDCLSQNAILDMEEENMVKIPQKAPEHPEDIVIMIDPGHGGEDEGCARQGVLEKDINMALAQLTKTKLEEKGYQVLLTHEDDNLYTGEERVRKAEEAGANLYVSIHQNAHETDVPNGIEVWYCKKGDELENMGENERLACIFQKYLIEATGANDRGISHSEDLYVIRECSMPSVLVETGFLSNGSERRKLLDEQYREMLAGGIADAIDVYFFPKTMYLTFDDGPSKENTEKILDILKEKNLKATFFVVGENVERYPEVTRRIVEEGHTIGIHCYSHDYQVIYESADAYMEDFHKAQEAVYEITGVRPVIFRFPGGSINAHNRDVYEEIIFRMTEAGYQYYDWNASLDDAVGNPNARMLVENAKTSTLHRRKIILLAHDVVDETVICLPEVISSFPEYEILPLEEKVEPICF